MSSTERAARRNQRDAAYAAIGAASVALAIFAVFMMFTTSSTISRIDKLANIDVNLFDDAWEIRYQDEVLTQSAARYTAASAEDQAFWKERYDDSVLELERALSDSAVSATAEEQSYIDNVSVVNDRLIELETQMFDLTDEGRAEDAQTILEGEYADLKTEYTRGLDQFFAAQELRIERQLDRASIAGQVARGAVILLAMFMAGALLVLFRSSQAQRNRFAVFREDITERLRAIEQGESEDESSNRRPVRL